jgi:molecular chaperone GrpE
MIPQDENNLNNEQPGKPEKPENPADEALAAEKKKAEEYLDSWRRTQAEFINYKRRTEQEKQDLGKFATAGFVLGILPVLDDLERAINAIPPDFSEHDWVKGILLVERKLRSSMESHGVKQVLALGMAFDPNFHEAVRQVPGPEGVIIQEFRKGYTLNDKLLRPAQVVVGSGEGPAPEEQESTPG